MGSESMATEQGWDHLSEKLRTFLFSCVSDEQVAEDLLQETGRRIHNGIDGINDVQRITSKVGSTPLNDANSGMPRGEDCGYKKFISPVARCVHRLGA